MDGDNCTMKQTTKHEGKDIFEAIKEAVSLKEYCESQCGISFQRIGKSYRANSPFTNAKGAFAINIATSEIWHDFTEKNSQGRELTGDVIELSALLNHNGDKKAALLELLEYLPESERERYSHALTKHMADKKAVQETIAYAHEALISGRYDIQHWIKYLHSRGVDDEQIRRLKLGYDTNSFRLLIPRFDYNGEEVRYYNTRRMPNKDGHENEKEPKYLMAEIGDNTFLKNMPLGLQTLSRKSRYLVCTEGEFDYMSFEREGFAVVGKFSNKFWPEILSHAEGFERVILAYDNDEQGQRYTKEAGNYLFANNIPFRVCELPDKCKDVNDFTRGGDSVHSLIEDALDGLDYLALSFIPPQDFDSMTRSKKKAMQKDLKAFLFAAKRHGADDSDLLSLCEKLSGYYSAQWLAEVLKEAKRGETEFDTVETLCEKNNLMYNARTGFYRYDEKAGIWINLDDCEIGTIVREYLGRLATSKKIRSITEHLKAAVASTEPIEYLNRLPLFGFKNGTLHYQRNNAKEELFRPFDATDFLTRRVAYQYDAEATCLTWLNALDTMFGGDSRRVACLQEFFGYCLLNHCRYQKALILRDKDERGSNGKSTILEVFRAVLGEENTTSLEPYQFGDEHEVIRLKDAKANICSDAKPEASNITGGEAVLKKAITGDSLNGRKLFKDSIEFKNTAKIIFALNGTLKTKDKSGSMQRRFLLIDCVARFVDGDPQEGTNEVKKDTNMTAKLMKELAGIFNWCVEGAKRLIKNGGNFTATDEQAELDGVFKKSGKTESVEAFADEFLPDMFDTDGKGKSISFGETYGEYTDYCETNNIAEKLEYQPFHKVFQQVLEVRAITYSVKQTRKERRVYNFLRMDEIMNKAS